MIVVAMSSAILSFDGLKKVALEAKIPEHLAFLFPIAVDTTILMGSLAVLLYELFGVKAVFGWVTVLFGTFLSIVGNVISVKDAGLIAQVLHGIIPVLLCISLESLLRILRFNIKRTRLARNPLPHLRSADEDEEPETVHHESKVAEIKSIPVSVRQNHLPAPVTSDTPPVITPSPVPSAVADVPSPPVAQEKEIKPAELASEPVAAAASTVIDAPVPVATASAIKEETSSPVIEPVPVIKPAPKKAPEVAKEAPSSKPAAPAQDVPDTVEKYRVVLAAFPDETPKARKVAEILRVYPEATGKDIKMALGDAPSVRIDSTMARAREWLKKN